MRLPIINGRECIPLRLTRFITCSRFSADVLLYHLCHELGLEHTPLYAYENSGVEKPPVSWLNKLAAIEGLLDTKMSPELEAAGGDIGWIEKSTLELPAGVFVYRDEFEAYVERWQPAKNDPDNVFSYSVSDIPNSLLQSVWEGFEMPSTFGAVVVEREAVPPVIAETDTELCDRLKAQGLDVKAIAREMKRVFPNILPSRIGRFLPAHPGANITSDAHTKRGKRLLG